MIWTRIVPDRTNLIWLFNRGGEELGVSLSDSDRWARRDFCFIKPPDKLGLFSSFHRRRCQTQSRGASANAVDATNSAWEIILKARGKLWLNARGWGRAGKFEKKSITRLPVKKEKEKLPHGAWRVEIRERTKKLSISIVAVGEEERVGINQWRGEDIRSVPLLGNCAACPPVCKFEWRESIDRCRMRQIVGLRWRDADVGVRPFAPPPPPLYYWRVCCVCRWDIVVREGGWFAFCWRCNERRSKNLCRGTSYKQGGQVDEPKYRPLKVSYRPKPYFTTQAEEKILPKTQNLGF